MSYTQYIIYPLDVLYIVYNIHSRYDIDVLYTVYNIHSRYTIDMQYMLHNILSRYAIDVLCYGIIYGMGSKSLSEQLLVEEEAADQLLADFQSTFIG